MNLTSSEKKTRVITRTHSFVTRSCNLSGKECLLWAAFGVEIILLFNLWVEKYLMILGVERNEGGVEPNEVGRDFNEV